MTAALTRIAGGVELHAEEREPVADARADRRRVLADAAGEHERLEAAQRRRIARRSLFLIAIRSRSSTASRACGIMRFAIE